MGLFEVVGFLFLIISGQVGGNFIHPVPQLKQLIIRKGNSTQLSMERKTINSHYEILSFHI